MELNPTQRKQIAKQIAVKKELARREAGDDFWQFCLYMDYKFFISRESILKQIADAYQEIEDGVISKLYVAMPPRAGKSYITTLYCAWILGRHPSEAIMRNTVTGTLYAKFSEDLRDMMQGQTHGGRYLNVFPDIEFATEKVSGWKLVDSRTGMSYFGAGVGGSIIGFGATKAAILDDSIKNAEEAMSEVSLEKKYQWYTSTHKSRLEKGVPEIHIATRWSKRDIPGRLIEVGYFDKIIEVPAMVDGETFCDNVHSTEEYLEIKNLTSDIIWEAEYMQNPVEAKGLLFPTDSLNRFKLKDIEDKKHEAIIGFCDTADTGSDYHSFPIAKQIRGKYYIIDVVFTQDPVEVNEPLTVSSIIRNQVEMATIESNNGGRIYSRDIRRELKRKDAYCNIQAQATTKNKETRILMQSGFIKEYFCFREDYKPGSEYAKFMEQLTTYSKEGKNKHDDAPDSLTGLSEMVRGGKKKLVWGR